MPKAARHGSNLTAPCAKIKRIKALRGVKLPSHDLLALVMGLETSSGMAQSLETRPTVSDLHGDNHWASVAKTRWLKQGKVPKVKHDDIKRELWDPLEKEGFPLRALLILENLNILEK